MKEDKLDKLQEDFPPGICIKHSLLAYETIERQFNLEAQKKIEDRLKQSKNP